MSNLQRKKIQKPNWSPTHTRRWLGEHINHVCHEFAWTTAQEAAAAEESGSSAAPAAASAGSSSAQPSACSRVAISAVDRDAMMSVVMTHLQRAMLTGERAGFRHIIIHQGQPNSQIAGHTLRAFQSVLGLNFASPGAFRRIALWTQFQPRFDARSMKRTSGPDLDPISSSVRRFSRHPFAPVLSYGVSLEG